MTEIDPAVSKYFSELSKKRKNPYLPFKGKEYAKAMSKKAKDAKKENTKTSQDA